MSKILYKRQHAVNKDGPALRRTPAGDAFSSLVILVFQLNGRLLKVGDSLSKPAGQTSARWQILAAAESGSMTVAQIAKALGLARQSVQRVADLLERDALAIYKRNPAHLRASLIQLTPKGSAVLRSIQSAQCAWADALGVDIGETDLRQAGAVLARVLRTLTNRNGVGQ
jgi:DNA-binding MarR family transcriptional regulator